MKLSDYFTPEEFAEYFYETCKKSSRGRLKITDDAIIYSDALENHGDYKWKESVIVCALFSCIDSLLAEKTGESKSVN